MRHFIRSPWALIVAIGLALNTGFFLGASWERDHAIRSSGSQAAHPNSRFTGYQATGAGKYWQPDIALLRLSDNYGERIIVRMDGNVELRDDVVLDSVSRKFWDFVASYARDYCDVPEKSDFRLRN